MKTRNFYLLMAFGILLLSKASHCQSLVTAGSPVFSIYNYGYPGHADQMERGCFTMQYYDYQRSIDPTVEQRKEAFEQLVRQYTIAHTLPDGTTDFPAVNVTIPVVVHIVYNTSDQNVSDARVLEQIDVMNRDYSGNNPHPMNSFPSSLKVNTDLQFCLAKQKPDGTPTNGIERRYTTVPQFGGDSVKHYSLGGMDAWDPTKYFNIWVCNLPSGLLGYAQFPWSGINSTFGLVNAYWCFGLTGAWYPFNEGGTASHEGGHCFTLLHIWGDENGCTGTDYCDDTPNQAAATTGHHTGTLTDVCSPYYPGIMYENFMDYSWDMDYSNFTPNQKTRIQSCFVPGGYLYSLLSSPGCSSVTTTLYSDAAINTVTDPDYYLFDNEYAYWCAVGIRNNVAGEDWDIYLYSDDGFNTPAIASSTYSPPANVDFVVLDNNHAPQMPRGIRADRWSGSGTATIEYEGYNEQLSIGSTDLDWPAGDVVEMTDVYLSPGLYAFTLEYNSGSADLDMSLFASNGTAFYGNRGSYMATSQNTGTGIPETFLYNVTTADWYGLCVWSRDANPANYKISIGTPGTWTGAAGDNNWHNPANWSGHYIPTSSIDVTIPEVAYKPWIWVTDASCHDLTIEKKRR